MNGPIVIVGFGAVGKALTTRLTRDGREVRVVQRSPPEHLPRRAAFVACDVLNTDSTSQALRGASQVVCALGFPYVASIWESAWPKAMRSILSACAEHGARLALADNLYMYGPRNGPLIETLPVVDYGRKPRARAEVTRLWRAAHEEKRVRVVAVRAPDLYGQGVVQSLLGEQTLGRLAQDKDVVLLERPDVPHDIAHVDDFARALVSLIDAPDDAYGQAWHVPCDQTRTLRAALEIAADALGGKLRIRVPPRAFVRLAGVFSPALREVDEMRFLFDRPYSVDWRKFAARFWSDPTPATSGIPDAALWFRRNPTLR